MRTSRLLTTLLALALVVVLVPAALAAPRAASAGGTSVDVIVVLEDGADARDAAADAARDHGFALRHVYEHALRGYAGSVPEGRLRALRNDPRVDYVERDQVASITAQAVPTGIDRIFATDNVNIDIDDTDDVRVDADVAVLDTGIDLEHPDLNVVSSVSCFYSSGGPPHTRTYTCGDGGDDDHYHGTHVAGTVAALDNGVGVVGVAPGARLWAVKVLDSNGSGPFSVIIAGVDYVTANAGAIDVANMSLGCKCTSTALDEALTESVAAGVSYAISAGNSDADTKDFSPAGHDDVITVSAIADFNGLPGGGAAPTCRSDIDDTLADFSNWGADVDITAPGVCILSTYPLEKGEYATISGTSMSSPHVAGAAALLYASGTSSPPLIKAALQDNGNLDWHDDSFDGFHEKLLDVSNETVFKPTMAPAGSEPEPTAPPAPSDLEATAVSSSRIDLSWTDVEGETHYELSIDGGTPIELTAGSSSYTHTALSASTEYHYTLTAVNGTLASAAASDSATTLSEGTVEPSGIDLTATGSKFKGEKTVDLTWTGTEASSVDVYRDGSKVKTIANDGAFSETLGKGGGSYTYKVCEAGTSTCSNDATVTF